MEILEKDGKKVVDLSTKNRYYPYTKEEAFEIKYLSQDKPETIQYVQKLLVNNSAFLERQLERFTRNKSNSHSMSKAIEQPFYTEMRTNQQLSYIVWSYPRGYDDTYYPNF